MKMIVIVCKEGSAVNTEETAAKESLNEAK